MNIRMSKGSWVAVLIFLTIVFMASLWMIDISVSAMNVSGGFLGEAKLSNGFWIRSPCQAYHVALWLAVISFFSMSMIATKFLLEEETNDKT